MDASTKKRLLALLNSRKALVVLCSVIAMLGAKLGLDVNDEMVMSIAAVTVALVFAIAGEDMATKATDNGRTEAIDQLQKDLDSKNGQLDRAVDGWNEEAELSRQYANDLAAKKEVVKLLEDRIRELEAAASEGGTPDG